ncbi:MAG: sigma-70 family RNA polymerase sigma factor [Planctomycetota bacterium]|nr:sigma-70 family RNA polymerase sigma factor [Planctomycetota bacterium]
MFESESILLQRFARTGDPEVFSELVRRHAGLVYGASLRILTDKDRAADAVQDTFFQLLRNAQNISGSLPNWLHRVATRKAIDVLRRDSSRKQREAQYAANKPRQVTKWQDLSPCIDEVLEELDDQTRGIIVQHFFEGQTTSNIASKLSLSQPTISRRIEAGVAKLREKLQRRGIVVTVAALAALLVENAAQAAPAVVLKELGKMALVGTQVAAASGAGAAASASGAGAKAAVGGVLTGVKAKIITAAAVTAIGVGSVVTYKQVTAPVQPPDNTVTEEVGRPSMRRSQGAGQRQRPTRSMPTVGQQPQELTDVLSESGDYKVTTGSEFVEPVATMGAPDQVDYKYSPPNIADGAVVWPSGEITDSPEGDEGPPMGYGGYGGGYYGGGYGGQAEDPNAPDSNSPSEEP